jgi:hypothetical protein
MEILQPDNRDDLRQLLAGMNLTPEVFEQALAWGAADAASYSDGAPACAPEMARWMRTVEGLHTGVMSLQRGWIRRDPQGQPTWIDPKGHCAVVVSSGTGCVGYPTGAAPRTRNPKGPSFNALVDNNNTVMLFHFVSDDAQMIDAKTTWVFLYNAQGDVVRSELALPVAIIGSSDYAWQKRILFPPFDCRGSSFDIPDNGDSGQDFGFTIERL